LAPSALADHRTLFPSHDANEQPRFEAVHLLISQPVAQFVAGRIERYPFLYLKTEVVRKLRERFARVPALVKRNA
jgi:hypothetical protein